MVNLVETGVTGLDNVLNGGILECSAVLLSGNPGTGKSILGQEFIYEGAREHDSKGLYLSFEESREEIRQTAASVGFEEWDELVERRQIDVFDKRDLLREDDVADAMDLILRAIDEESYDRLVLDSLTMFQLFFAGEKKQRQYLLKFIDILKQNGITSIMTHEQSAVFPKTEIGLVNFLTDGNVYLAQVPTSGAVNRYLWVAKMRRQSVDNDVFPIEITDDGMTVYDSAASFSLIQGDWGDDD